MCFSFWGTVPPLDPIPGLRPWTPLGGFRRPDVLACAVLKFPLEHPCVVVCHSHFVLDCFRVSFKILIVCSLLVHCRWRLFVYRAVEILSGQI